MIITDDMIGGFMLTVAAIFQGMTLVRAYREKSIKGVHPAMIWYLAFLNLFYVYFFSVRFDYFSAFGELCLGLTQCVWIGQYYLYREPKIKYVTNEEADAYQTQREAYFNLTGRWYDQVFTWPRLPKGQRRVLVRKRGGDPNKCQCYPPESKGDCSECPR